MSTRDGAAEGAATLGAAIVVSDLRKSYGSLRALDGLTVSVPRGALCGLIGPNGAGKTTLLSILATLDEDFTGDAVIAGASVRNAPLEVRKRIGFVPDYTPLYDALTVRELMSFFAAASGLPKIARRRAVDTVVDLCGLESIIDRPSAGLSKGQTQRVTVARALLHDPDVLILDEPASGLDPRARIELKELLKKLGERQKTVLVSSHILTELGDFCDHVVIVERGRVVAAGPIDELTRDAHGTRETPRRLRVEIDRPAKDVEALLRGLSCVRDVQHEGTLLFVTVGGARGEQASVARALVEANVGVLEIAEERQSLEALFLTVTKGGAA